MRPAKQTAVKLYGRGFTAEAVARYTLADWLSNGEIQFPDLKKGDLKKVYRECKKVAGDELAPINPEDEEGGEQ